MAVLEPDRHEHVPNHGRRPVTAPTHNLTSRRDMDHGFVYWSCGVCPGVFGRRDAHDELLGADEKGADE